jgi:peptide deformylase
MAKREIVLLGDPILRQKAKKVTRFDAALPRLVADMYETLRAAKGVGLAAPQIGLAMRLLVIEYRDEERRNPIRVAMANPEIVEAAGEQVGVDACLSIPGYYGVNVRRAYRVLVRGQDLRGRTLRVPAEGFLAWALQHEIDHLDGILFLDRLDRPEDLRPVEAGDPVAGRTA